MKSVNQPRGSSQTKPAANTKTHILPVLILVVATFAIYAQTLHADFLYWDDNVNVFQNPYLTRLTPANIAFFWKNPYEQLYIPVSYTIYSLLAEAGRMSHTDASVTAVPALINPRVFHLANVVMHTANALIVFAILWMLTGGRRPAALLLQNRNTGSTAGGQDAAVPDGQSGTAPAITDGERNETTSAVPALMGALLFALHPLQVETVAWITELRGLLCATFCLGAIYAYVKAARASQVRDASIWRFGGYWLALVLSILATLSKPSAVGLPLALLALDLWAVGRRWRSALPSVLPFLVLMIPLIVITSHSQPVPHRLMTPLWARPFIAGDALAFYLGKLIIPWNLTIDYGRRPMLVDSVWWGYVTWLVPAVIAAVIFVARRRYPLLVAAGFFSLSFLLPVLGLVPFIFQDFSTVADRYVYLAMFGPALAVATLLARVESTNPVRRQSALAVCGVVLAAFAVIAFVQTSHWRDSFSLFGYALVLHPDEYEVHDDMGVAYHTIKNYDRAIAEYQASIRLQPGFPGTYNDLGVAYFELGRVPEAITEFRTALSVDPHNDEHTATSLRNLGAALLENGQAADACDALLKAVEMAPANAESHSNYANALLAVNRVGDAVNEFQTALGLDPSLPEALYGLGQALAKEGRYTEAEASCRSAVAIKPQDPKAHDSLASVLCDENRYSDAIPEYQQAVNLAPNNAQFHYNFASGLLDNRDTVQATQEMQTAVRLNPSAANHDGLGILYYIAGNKDAARTEFETVLSMDPNNPNVRGQLAGLK